MLVFLLFVQQVDAGCSGGPSPSLIAKTKCANKRSVSCCIGGVVPSLGQTSRVRTESDSKQDPESTGHLRCPGVSGPDNDRTIFRTSLCGPKISGPHNDWSLSSREISGPENNHIVWSLSSPEISGPENDQIVWSLSGPGRCLVLLHRVF